MLGPDDLVLHAGTLRKASVAEKCAAAGMKFQSALVRQTPTIQLAYGRDPDGSIIELIDFAAT